MGCRGQNFRWDPPTLDPPIWVSNKREASGELICFCQNLPIPKSFNVKWIGAKRPNFSRRKHIIKSVPTSTLVWYCLIHLHLQGGLFLCYRSQRCQLHHPGRCWLQINHQNSENGTCFGDIVAGQFWCWYMRQRVCQFYYCECAEDCWRGVNNL